MTRKERLRRAARSQDVDRIPSIGGWMNGVANLAALAGISTDAYLADPAAGVVRANAALGVDGMVGPTIPRSLDQIRTGAVEEHNFAHVEPEAILDRANSLPDTEQQVLAGFDEQAAERRYREHFDNAFRTWRGIEPIPNFWEIGGHFPLYTEFGYTAFLSACALYPDAVGKIWWAKSLLSRQRAKILAKLYTELDLVPLMFCGEDLCNNKGPMCSPQFLRKHYLPTVRMIIEPLVDAGVRLVHHCDGDVRPLVGDYIGIGFSGLQGFQFEIGFEMEDFLPLRSNRGEELIFFTGMSVTRTLPFGGEDDVRDEVDYYIDATGGGRGMFLFTSNVTGVEVPPANIRAGYDHVKRYDPSRPRPRRFDRWPWADRASPTGK